ncbi:MAG: hypothetical protein A2Y62_05690 [Candidatus Fischerbacteria bacterium RBG_13_37_8]|uniref:TonB C-terminal domain-containing protein n=1 Tax=Candidatus Fischerbacteria bacterium RBG_13_37_8 TaxID=1817863 RepID=A0A1F5VXG5_9BACT|nr:MAG: hypothetical protein A2Y62_05690 [Candidatus Fischerbacteria bacterium RBG_13_37_8]
MKQLITQDELIFLQHQRAEQARQFFESSLYQKKNVRIAVLGAVIIHLIIFVIRFPQQVHQITEGPPPDIIRVNRPEVKLPPRPNPPIDKKFKTLPVPDPTPDEPEPIIEQKPIQPEDDFPTDNDSNIFIDSAGPPLNPDAPARIGENGEQAVLKYKVEPEYPEEARRARIEGVVILEAVIKKDGTVGDVEVIKSVEPSLDQAAIKAIKQFLFIPGKINGKPVNSYFIAGITFKLQ